MSKLSAVTKRKTKGTDGWGGPRENSGRKAKAFRKVCSELANSPKFFEFAKKVFNREKLEPRVTKDGEVIYIEPSIGDMVYLWEKLAAYGFGKPTDFDPTSVLEPLQKVINDTQFLKLVHALNYGSNGAGTKNGHPAVVAGGPTQI